MQPVQSAGPGRAEVLPGTFECKYIHVDALALGDLLETQHLAGLQDYRRRRACLHDPFEPQAVGWRMNGRWSGPAVMPPSLGRQAILFDRERHEVVKGASPVLPLEFPAQQAELVPRKLQLKLQGSHLARS